MRNPVQFSIVPCLVLAFAGADVQAQTYDWLLPIDGEWTSPFNWQLGAYPNGAGAIARLSYGSPYTVTLQGASIELSLLHVVNSEATLVLSNEGGSATIELYDSLQNEGVIWLRDAEGSGVANISTPSGSSSQDVVIGGDGMILLDAQYDPTGWNDARITVSRDDSITIGAGQTIAGNGSIYNYGQLFNHGLIDGTIEYRSGVDDEMTNLGTMRFTGGYLHADRFVNEGVLIVEDSEYFVDFMVDDFVGHGGVSRAIDSTLWLLADVVDGGRFETEGKGRVRISEDLELHEIQNEGRMVVEASYEDVELRLQESIVNNGTIVLDSRTPSRDYDAVLLADRTVSIEGDGVIELVRDNYSTTARLEAGPSRVLRLSEGQQVRGGGIVGGGGGTILNLGTISGNLYVYGPFVNEGTVKNVFRLGDVAGFTNNGMVIAEADEGTLFLYGTHELASGVYLADGGIIDVSHASYTNLNFQIANGGQIGIFDQSKSYTDWLNEIQFDVSNRQGEDLSLYLSGACYNNGSIRIIDEVGYRDASLSVLYALELRGDGAVELISSDEPDNASILLGEDATLDIGAGQHVFGNGTIHGPGMITNNGMISGSLVVGGLGSTFINNGLVTAADAKLPLRLVGTHLPGSGTYIADGGVLNLAGADISGLQFEQINGGRVIVQGGVASMRDQQNTGLIEVIGRTLYPRGEIVNNGRIQCKTLVNDSYISLLSFSGEDAEFTGEGVIELQAPDELNRAGIRVSRNRLGVFGSQQSIVGRGTLWGDGEIQLHGVLNPSGSDPVIAVQTSLRLSSDTEVVLDGIGGDQPDRLVVQYEGVMHIDGTLDVRFDESVQPAFGDRWALIEGTRQEGFFRNVITPDPPAGLIYRVETNSNETFIVLTCPGDLNADFRTDYLDIALFMVRFGVDDLVVDFDGDGDLDFYDVATFLAWFTQGCDA